MVEKKFGALRFVSGLFKVLAWIGLIAWILGGIGVFIAAVIAAGAGANASTTGIGSIIAGGILGGLAAMFGMIIFGLIQFVILKATSELFIVLVAIEYNTRETAYLMRGEQQPGMAPPPMR
jgi:hypothetical protein